MFKLDNDDSFFTMLSARIKKISPKQFAFFGIGFIIFLLVISLLFKVAGGTVKAICDRINDTDNSQMRQGRVVNVEAQPVKLGTMTKRITAVGRTKASESVVIKAETNGRIKEILFNEGGIVTKDQEIIKFENSDAKAELQNAEAQLSLAKANFERSSKIYEQKFGSAKEYDKVKAELEQAEAHVAVAKVKLEKTVIVAPFTGHIGLMEVNVGSYVQTGTELVTLVQTNPMKIDFKVPEKFVHEVGAGQTAEVRIDAFKDKVFTAFIEAIDSKVDSDSHSLAIRGSVNNETNELYSGLFTNISLIIGERGNTMMVDESAIIRDGALEKVWVIEKGKAKEKGVKTGVREKNMVEIVAGLTPNELIVTSGHARLQNGVRVKVLNDKAEIAKREAAKKAAAEKALAERLKGSVPKDATQKDTVKDETAKDAVTKPVEPTKESTTQPTKETANADHTKDTPKKDEPKSGSEMTDKKAAETMPVTANSGTAPTTTGSGEIAPDATVPAPETQSSQKKQ